MRLNKRMQNWDGGDKKKRIEDRIGREGKNGEKTEKGRKKAMDGGRVRRGRG